MSDFGENSRFWTDVAVFCVIFIVVYLLSGLVARVSIVLNLIVVVVSLLIAVTAVYTLRSGIFE